MNSTPPSYILGAPGLTSEGQPVAQFHLGDARNFVYLIIDWKTREAALVDCREELAPVFEALGKFKLKLTQILLTHTHWDHVHGLAPALAHDPSLRAYLHPEDRHRIASKIPSDRLVEIQDGETVMIGETRVHALHTPGHSAGEVTYRIDARAGHPPFLFTGDFLFIRDCGRTDFPDGSNEEMFRSIQKISRLDPASVILPGHYYARESASTLERELKESPPLRCQSVEELKALP